MNHRFIFGNFIPLLAIPFALLIPSVGQFFSPYASWILGTLLFFSFVGMGIEDLFHALRHPAKPFYLSLMILVMAPLVIYPIMQRFFPDYFLGALVFMVLPSAVSAPAVSAIYGGNVALASINTLLSSILSIFTIPLFFKFFLSAQVDVSARLVFFKLITIILIPFVLSLIAHRFGKKVLPAIKSHFRPISLMLLFLFFFAALSPYHQEMLANFSNGPLWLAVLITYLLLYAFAHLSLLYATDRPERIAVKSNILFLNVGLGLLVAQNYFGPTEVLFVVFAEIVWVALVALFKFFR